MPTLCDFAQIVGETPVTIGDSRPVFEQKFNTGGRNSKHPAFLIFNVQGLVRADRDVNVKINNQVVGKIFRYMSTTEDVRKDVEQYWYTQMIAFSGPVLNDGDNEIQIDAVGWSGATNPNKYDDFKLKDLICFFHQES